MARWAMLQSLTMHAPKEHCMIANNAHAAIQHQSQTVLLHWADRSACRDTSSLQHKRAVLNSQTDAGMPVLSQLVCSGFTAVLSVDQCAAVQAREHPVHVRAGAPPAAVCQPDRQCAASWCRPHRAQQVCITGALASWRWKRALTVSCSLAHACSAVGAQCNSCSRLLPPMASFSTACRGRYLVADPAPLWQKPLVSLSQFFLKTPVQVHAQQQTLSSRLCLGTNGASILAHQRGSTLHQLHDSTGEQAEHVPQARGSPGSALIRRTPRCHANPAPLRACRAPRPASTWPPRRRWRAPRPSTLRTAGRRPAAGRATTRAWRRACGRPPRSSPAPSATCGGRSLPWRGKVV